jgi:hypothetical protein
MVQHVGGRSLIIIVVVIVVINLGRQEQCGSSLTCTQE